jgi:uncharacterized protein (DUF924 family)
MDARVDEILEFWFGAPHAPNYGKERSFWFTKNPEFDREVCDRFLPIYTQAAAGELDNWQDLPQSCLALLLLLDQFPRNMFRGTPRSFATDAKAQVLANSAIAKGFDQDLLPVQRWFIYLPFEHSENLADQQRCVDLFSTLQGDPDSAKTIDYALRHKSIIERFGRFPHRNKILGRETTPEEAEFLKQRGSSF